MGINKIDYSVVIKKGIYFYTDIEKGLCCIVQEKKVQNYSVLGSICLVCSSDVLGLVFTTGLSQYRVFENRMYIFFFNFVVRDCMLVV